MNGFSTTVPPPRKRSFSVASLSGLLLTGFLALAPFAARARTIQVGPGRVVSTLAQAARLAADGDLILLDPVEHRGCAVWKASRLTIEGVKPGATVTGEICEDRAFFFFTGNDITVRNITFTHARALRHTGAGILMEGANLTVENSRFLDNENGILAGGPWRSIVRVRDSVFLGNGSCMGACAHGLYIGLIITRLEVTGCVFQDTHVGHHIKSKAAMTVIRDSRIEDGRDGTASYLIDLPIGGDAEISGNILQKGARSDNREAAISIGAESRYLATRALVIRDNRFTSSRADPVWFVRNLTATPALLTGNTILGNVLPLEGPGSVE